MVIDRVVRGLALLATAAAFCCGGPGVRYDGDADPYNGVVDNTFGAPTFTGTNFTSQGALAIQFQPSSTSRSTCLGNNSCYLPQKGFVNGQTILFFNAGVNKPSFSTDPPPYPPVSCATWTAGQAPPIDYSGFNCAYAPSITDRASDGGGGWQAYSFAPGCKPVPFDPVLDAFSRDRQFPIASALPINNLALSSPKPPLGLVGVHGVSGVAGETCNDIKYFSSVGTKGDPGKFGSIGSASPTGYEVWMIFDPTVAVYKTSPATSGGLINPKVFWFNGLQGAYVSGGAIPVDANGNLIAMDGVIVDPSSATSFASPTADNVVLLPYQPGDGGYSPIVRLHEFHTKSSPGTLTGVCPIGATTCPANFVKLSDAGASAFNTIFIAASPQ
ncbi:MAG: hypothetical protein ABR567_06090 [Myxococcales bacterium]